MAMPRGVHPGALLTVPAMVVAARAVEGCGGMDLTGPSRDGGADRTVAIGDDGPSTGGDDGIGASSGGPLPPGCMGDAGQPLRCYVDSSCPRGSSTTLKGTAFDPARKNPLGNAFVYVPNSTSALPPIATGTNVCTSCATPIGDYASMTITGSDGSFTLRFLPSWIPITTDPEFVRIFLRDRAVHSRRGRGPRARRTSRLTHGEHLLAHPACGARRISTAVPFSGSDGASQGKPRVRWLVHEPGKPLVPGVGLEIALQRRGCRCEGHVRIAGDVRRGDDVRLPEQRSRGVDWFVGEDVEAGAAELPALQRIDERRRVHELAASDVHEEGASLHRRKDPAID